MRERRSALAALLLSAAALACATGGTGGAPEPPPRPAVDAPTMPLVTGVPVFDSVPVPASYRAAVRGGTRTPAGRPGPEYWQQRVHYDIDARLVPDSARVEGRETVTYVNRSPDTLRSLYVHLYQNVYSAGVQRNRTVQLTGGTDLRAVTFEGDTLREMDRDRMSAGSAGGRRGYVVRGTLARLFLPDPLAPGEEARLGFAWSFRVPGAWSFRTGHIDREIFNVAQWYPQIATYDDVAGHDVTPYLGDGEFYLEYGSFELDLTVPEGWLVSATGLLNNAGEVLAPGAVERMRAARSSDTVVAVVDSADLAAGRVTRDVEGDLLTWRFRTTVPVRDAAFAASSRYVWDAVGADVGGPEGRIRVDALYDPSVSHWSEAAAYSKHSLEFFSDYLTPYPYPRAKATYGPIGGMEYPMLVFIGRSSPGEPLYSVLAHEFSHEWVPMMVGTKEAHYAWMDEGLTTFNESLARMDYFDGSAARRRDRQLYLQAARAGVEAPLMRHTDHVENGFGRGVAAYMKPGTLLHALRAVLGRETFDEAYRSFYSEWSWKHPYPWDFFRTMERVAGRDLDWFWKPWFFETATLDQAVAGVERTADGVQVTVENLDRAVMPVRLRIRTADGTTRRAEWPVDVWSGTRTVTRTVALPAEAEVTRVALDPERWFPDVDRSNNTWESAEETP
ncbi:MAG: M1 family metallopeptidase [Candidatus Palauibacterales bacterium]|nr:M1 family metallopeptidase [Candidatus Palauibacterales bacterium]